MAQVLLAFIALLDKNATGIGFIIFFCVMFYFYTKD